MAGRACVREGGRADRLAHLSAHPPSRTHAIHHEAAREGRGEVARIGVTVVIPLSPSPSHPLSHAHPPALMPVHAHTHALPPMHPCLPALPHAHVPTPCLTTHTHAHHLPPTPAMTTPTTLLPHRPCMGV